MIKKYHKHGDRRHKSTLRPVIYLMLELIALGLIYLVAYVQFEFVILRVLIALGMIYFVITSSLKRYRKVQERQRFYNE